jgi:hypothetical protein
LVVAPQAPLNTSSTPSKVLVAVTVWAVAVAVKLYQTSLAAEDVKPLQGIGAMLCVAPATVPLVEVQFVPGVSTTALAQSSLAGAWAHAAGASSRPAARADSRARVLFDSQEKEE